MGIPNRTVVQLQTEGLGGVEDQADFDKETIEGIASNLRRSVGRIADPNPGAAAGATIRTPPFAFGAKSQQRLIVSTKLLRFYDTVGRVTAAGNLQWMPVMKNFSEQWLAWKALEDKKGGNEPDIPMIIKEGIPMITKEARLPIIKWTEAFRDYLHREIGVCTIPLAYVIHPNATVPTIGPQATGAPHSVEHEAEIKRHEQLMHTRQWKGQSNFTFERFIAQH